MKFNFEHGPKSLEDAQEMLELFAQADIDPPQEIKKIILDATARGFATGEEHATLADYLGELTETRKNDAE